MPDTFSATHIPPSAADSAASGCKSSPPQTPPPALQRQSRLHAYRFLTLKLIMHPIAPQRCSQLLINARVESTRVGRTLLSVAFDFDRVRLHSPCSGASSRSPRAFTSGARDLGAQTAGREQYPNSRRLYC